MSVANPVAPRRGTFHIDHDGSAASLMTTAAPRGDFPAAELDDDGVGRLIDEAGNTLRACGQLIRRQPSRYNAAPDG
jgi:hypothetical protein